MVPPVIEALRAATRAAHEAIEAVPALARLTSPGLTRAGYVATLAGLCRFHAALEPRLVAALGGAGLPPAGRGVALAADLRRLGAKVPRPAPARALPALPDRAAALGCLYVVEGSALGGRVIARRVADTLGLGPTDGAGFFGADSAEAARARWAALGLLLDDAWREADAAARDRLLAGARDCFAALAAWMGPQAAPRRPIAVRAALQPAPAP